MVDVTNPALSLPTNPQFTPAPANVVAPPMAEEPSIYLDPAEQASDTITVPSLIPEQVTFNPSAESLERRAQKANFALGPDSPGIDQLRATYLSPDGETAVRTQVSVQEQIRNQRVRQQLLGQMLEQETKTGVKLAPEDIDYILGLGQEQLQNPQTVLEKLYARRLVNALTTMSASNWQNALNESLSVDAEKTYNVMDAVQDIATKQEIANSLLQQTDDKLKNQSWTGYIVDQAKSFFPGYDWAKLRNRYISIQGPAWLLGNNIAEQVQGMYLLPPDQFHQTAVRALDELSKDNPRLAKEFAQALVSFSTSDAAMQNAGTMFDAADYLTLGVTAARRPVLSIAQRLRAGLKQNANPAMEIADALVTAGNVEAAAEQKAGKLLSKRARGEDEIKDLIQTQTFGLLDPENYARSAGSLANERTRRLVGQLEESAIAFKKSTSGDDTLVLPRVMEPEAIAKGFQNAEIAWKRNYPHIVDSVLDIRPERLSEEVFGGVDRIVIDLGRKDATPFETENQARLIANLYRLSKGQYEIVQKDANWVIRMTKYVDETDPRVVELRVGTDNAAPVSFMNRLLGWGRSSKDVVSDGQKISRDVATYASNQVVYYLRKALENLKMTKTQRSRVEDLLRQNQTELRAYPQPNGQVKMLEGNWYNTFGEFENAYRAKFNELPSDAEYLAYFTYQQAHEWELGMLKTGRLRDKTRIGGEQKALTFVDGQNKKQSAWFEGKSLQKLPDWNTPTFTVGWIDEKGGKHFKISNRLTNKEKAAIDDLVAKGYEVLQPLDPADEVVKDLLDVGSEVVNYVLSKQTKTKPLDLDAQMEVRFGPHSVYDQNTVFIKGTNSWKGMGRRLYGGDVTLQGFNNPAQAQKFLDAYTTARQMINDQRLAAGILDFLHKNTPFRTIKEFKELFKPDGGPLDWEGPLVLLRDGQKISDTTDLTKFYRERVDDIGLSYHNPLANVNGKFTQERQHLYTVNEAGTQANPLYNIARMQTIDPMDALKRSVQDLVRARFFEDYKHREVENWVTQFRHLLDVSEHEAFANPMKALRDFPSIMQKKGADLNELAAAKNSRRAILQLLSQESPLQQHFNWAREKLWSEIYNRWGQEGVKKLEKGTQFIPEWMITAATSPITAARSLVFHAKLGLWNPLQFPLQYQSVIHAAAIDGNPLRATQAGLSAWMMRTMRMADYNPGLTTHFGRAARKALGISEAEYAEMYRGLQRSGMMNVEGETAMLDDYFAPNVMNTGVSGRIADSSKIFFTEGERLVRMTAYNTAYLNWRQNNPLAKFTPEVERAVIRRADDLAINMSRASNTPLLQQGPQSMTTQFMTYHARLSEQLLGGRLTASEKARVMLMYSAMYGVPLGIAGTTLGPFLPVYETYRKYALDSGINLDDWKVKAFFEGAGSLAVSAIAEQDVNFAQRYGPGGISFLKDVIIDGKVSVLFGPAGSFISDIIKHSEPFSNALWSIFDPKANETFPLKAEDFVDALREISVVNNAVRGYAVWQTGMLMTKNDLIIGKSDAKMSLFTFLTGMQPQFGTDAFLKGSILKDEALAKNELEKHALKYFNRSIMAWKNGDMDEGKIQATRARVFLKMAGMSDIEVARTMAKFTAQLRDADFAEQIAKNFVTKAPANKREERLRNWQRQNQNGSPY